MTTKVYKLVTERQVFSVSDLTRNIRFNLEENFQNIWVEGEISNFKRHTSGHMYFSLKDENAQIQCVMFRRENHLLNFEPAEGIKAVCFGRVSVYAVRGQYQLYVERLEPKGIGALQLKFEELKERLRKEGLFDQERKKPIPFLPKKIAVVTSIDGAALQDILNIIGRRFSSAHLLIYPVQVQGISAASGIAEAIQDINRWQAADVMIVGRGGGSLEDLWAFNEEIVARAIYDSEIPVISAVGHEVDYTIADFVSDLRAPTPSAAAEIVLPVKEALLERLEELGLRSFQSVVGRIKNHRRELEIFTENRSLREPLAIFERSFQQLDELIKNLSLSAGHKLEVFREKVASMIGKLEVLGPLSTLKRGFSVSLKLPDEKIVTAASSLRIGDKIKTRLNRGFFVSEVKEINL